MSKDYIREPEYIQGLRYTAGNGPYPGVLGDSVNANLRASVAHVWKQECEIKTLRADNVQFRTRVETLETQLRQARAERSAQISSEAARPPSASVQVIPATKEEICGAAAPCGQMMRIDRSVAPNGFVIFAQCMLPGRPINGGKCAHHAIATATAPGPAIVLTPAPIAPSAPASAPAPHHATGSYISAVQTGKA